MLLSKIQCFIDFYFSSLEAFQEFSIIEITKYEQLKQKNRLKIIIFLLFFI
jgi:hypothetical protein